MNLFEPEGSDRTDEKEHFVEVLDVKGEKNNVVLSVVHPSIDKNKQVREVHFRKSTSSNQTELNHTKPNSSIPNFYTAAAHCLKFVYGVTIIGRVPMNYSNNFYVMTGLFMVRLL